MEYYENNNFKSYLKHKIIEKKYIKNYNTTEQLMVFTISDFYNFYEIFTFQAETRMLLDIVAKSLYSEKEVKKCNYK